MIDLSKIISLIIDMLLIGHPHNKLVMDKSHQVCDLDIWPDDLSIIEECVLVMPNLYTKFEVCRSKGSPVINRTSFPTDRQTDGHVCKTICSKLSIWGHDKCVGGIVHVETVSNHG